MRGILYDLRSASFEGEADEEVGGEETLLVPSFTGGDEKGPDTPLGLLKATDVTAPANNPHTIRSQPKEK